LVFYFWFSAFQLNLKLQRNGFSGPPPRFPMGNINEMKREGEKASHGAPLAMSNDIHSIAFPYFAKWRLSYGKVFVYWLGTEPFLYIGDPGFLKQVSNGVVMSKAWGKPTVFKRDRDPMFGKGLVMVEGDDWVRHRRIITPAFSSGNLKAMISLMVETTNKMLDEWTGQVNFDMHEINVEGDIIKNAAEIIAKTRFGMNQQYAERVFEKLKAMQVTLYRSGRLLGVPFGRLVYLKQTLEERKLGKEIDDLLLSIITARKASHIAEPQKDLLGLLLPDNHVNELLGKKLSPRELVDECKTFFFGGHETTALAVSWTLFLLAKQPKWQTLLREEIMEVTGGEPLDFTMLPKLEKMGWVMNEVLRLYPPAPNVQRQVREDIQVGDTIIPKGTNIWIDLVGMHHDPALWGEDVNEFRPERFKEDVLYGGCKHKMGYLPFGFGGRMCVGRNLALMEYKTVLSLILTRFSMSLSPNYLHSPTHLLSLRPSCGMPLILQPITPNHP